MSDFEEEYKTFRNYLRKLAIDESIGVVRAFSQKNNFGAQLPNDLRGVPPQFRIASHHPIEGRVLDWHLEILAREMLIDSRLYGSGDKDLRIWNDFANAIKKIAHLENTASKELKKTTDALFFEFLKLSHRQFPWQNRPDTQFVYTFYWMFKQNKVRELFEAKLGIDPRTAYLIGLSLIGHFQDNLGLYTPPSLRFAASTNITDDTFRVFISILSKPIGELREMLKNDPNRQMGSNFFYYDHSLRRYPLVLVEHQGKKALICPLPTLLFWRFTDGFYYDLVGQKNFDNAFGDAFEDYVGVITNRALRDTDFSILPKEPESITVGSARKHLPSPDWFVSQGNYTLFVECKAKRLPVASRLGTEPDGAFRLQIDKMASFAEQVYRAIDTYRKNLFRNPQYQFDKDKKIIPLVVTLHSWHLIGPIFEQLEQAVKKKLKALGIEDLLVAYPYAICSVEEYEVLLSVIKAGDSIERVLADKIDRSKEYCHWELLPYLSAKFSATSSPFLFEEDFQQDFPETTNF